MHEKSVTVLVFLEQRWLYRVFRGQYLRSLSINYVAINKELEKLLPQLYYITSKICYDQGYNDITVVIATKWRHYLFYLQPEYFLALPIVHGSLFPLKNFRFVFYRYSAEH